MTTLIIAVCASILVSALCSLLESVLYSTRVITLEAAAAQGNRLARAMRAFKTQVDRPLAAILILNTAANTAGAALAGWAAGQVWGAGSLWAFSAFFTLAILIFSEIIPKTVGAVFWRVLWGPSIYPLKIMVLVLKPFIWMTQAITGLITAHRKKGSPVSEDEIVAAARLGASGGEISRMEAELINNIIQLEEITAEDIMTPRTVMMSLDGALTVDEVELESRHWPHTRVPVWRDNPDQVVGYVLQDIILRAVATDQEKTLFELAKPVRFVPPGANALKLLASFLGSKDHLVVVVDEYGGVMGLVTLEDVIESLVGSEIVDETDEEVDLQEAARRRAKAVLKASREDD
ncbi:MAG: hemolysin family protein [Desulfarculaceae bacterium]|nr:hemolysin family protein [Desulfarculaceae bacterium]MCF8074184.1 hemolysin family protein [Desulfarculaceae bacterium]MCF8102765.1 hemolysin family protein [Desulfarculaceae bacterium]MCF8116380.1 hemolysin family protein [Desulfarculaceae bacterium]